MDEPKQIKIDKYLSRAIATNNAAIDRLAVEAMGAQQKLQAASQAHQNLIAAVIQGAGYKPEEFQSFGVWEEPETGEIFLRAQ